MPHLRRAGFGDPADRSIAFTLPTHTAAMISLVNLVERGISMPPLRNPIVAELAPSGPALTKYDEEHAITYVRMLDADADGADWRDVSRIVLRIDPDRA
jgi:hypothetical protein